MNITAIVRDRVIEATVNGTHVAGGGCDNMSYTLDAEWADKEHLAVWFANGEHPEVVPISGTSGEVAIPPCKPGTLRLTFDGWNDGDETHLLTERMARGIKLRRHGQHTFGCLDDEVNATISNLVKATDMAQEATKESRNQVTAAQASEEQRQQTFASKMNDWSGEVDAATAYAQAIADSVRQRAESGEFNGAAFAIKYERASFEEIQAIADASEGDFAIIIGSDKLVDDYGKLYTFNGSEWHLVTDMSVPGPAIKGDKGDKGVSVSGATISGDNLVIKTTDPSTGATAEHDAGSLADVAAPVVTAQLDSRILVMDKSDYDALTEYATGVVYLVRQ